MISEIGPFLVVRGSTHFRYKSKLRKPKFKNKFSAFVSIAETTDQSDGVEIYEEAADGVAVRSVGNMLDSTDNEYEWDFSGSEESNFKNKQYDDTNYQ